MSYLDKYSSNYKNDSFINFAKICLHLDKFTLLFYFHPKACYFPVHLFFYQTLIPTHLYLLLSRKIQHNFVFSLLSRHQNFVYFSITVELIFISYYLTRFLS